MSFWNREKINYYKIASEHSDFHLNLALILEGYLKLNESVLEAGSGFGYLSHILGEMGYKIRGCEADEDVFKEASLMFPDSFFINADLFSTDLKADVLLCVFFGHIRENLDKLLSHCDKRLIYVTSEHQNEADYQEFAASKALASFLTDKGLKYTYSLHTLPFFQPLKDEADGARYKALWYGEREVNLLLQPLESQDYRFNAVKYKSFGVFSIEKESKE